MTTLLLQAVYYFISILIVIIIANAILSWFPAKGLLPLRKILYSMVEPILQPIRKMIQKSIFGGSRMAVDISPFIAYLILSTIQRYLSYYLYTG